ncbi:peroxiredoxin [Polaribacter sp. NJDZ03]|nr:hypothetical protein [Polaribacter sp. NJDZ03]
MRKIIISIIVLGLSAIIFVVAHKALSIKEIEKEKTTFTKSNSTKLPLFEFFTLDSIPYSRYSLKKDKSLVLVYFDPDCGLCNKSGKVFGSFKKFHEKSQVLFVSYSSKDKIEAYKKRHNLNLVPNIKFLQCSSEDFYALFKESITPTYFIYNTKQELIKKINDDVPVKTILRYIKAAQVDEQV